MSKNLDTWTAGCTERKGGEGPYEKHSMAKVLTLGFSMLSLTQARQPDYPGHRAPGNGEQVEKLRHSEDDREQSSDS